MKRRKILSFILIIFTIFTLTGCIDVRATQPYTPQSDHESALINATKNAEMAVVAVVTNSGHGSGVIYLKEEIDSTNSLYYVMTNHHVIENQDEVIIYYSVRDNEYDDLKPSSTGYFAKDVQSTPMYDIAVVRFIAPSDLQVDILPILSTNEDRLQLVKMQTVIAIGSPYEWQSYFNYATEGVISQFNYAYNNVDSLSIKHSAAINPGNSGGALINLKGELIGINVSKIATIQTQTGPIAADALGNALNINVIGPHVLKYKESDYSILVKKPRLGITIVNMDDFKNPDFGYDQSLIVNRATGVVVVGIDKSRGAYNIAKVYDVIIAANGTPINTTAELAASLGEMQFGQSHTLTVLRLVNGQSKQLTLTITIV